MKDYPFIGSQQDCPQDWVRDGRSCYLLINTTTLKWSDARATCQTYGADLPIIRSADENKFILDLVKSQPTVQEWGAWLGLYRKPPNEEFYWIDDTPLAGHFSAWSSGEPNNNAEKCVHIYPRYGHQGNWNDNKCDLANGQRFRAPLVLCQKYLT